MIQKKESLLRKAAIFAMDKWKAYVRLAQVWGPVFGNQLLLPWKLLDFRPCVNNNQEPNYSSLGVLPLSVSTAPTSISLRSLSIIWRSNDREGRDHVPQKWKTANSKKKGAMDQKSMRKIACQKENEMM